MSQLQQHEHDERRRRLLHQQQQQVHRFRHAKHQALYGKRDKSSAGQYDTGVIEICSLINEGYIDSNNNDTDRYYTTSSCAGRCFIYTGMGIKATNTFTRYRISHISIIDPIRYFQLSTLHDDPTGGGDPITYIYDGGKRQRKLNRNTMKQNNDDDDDDDDEDEGDNIEDEEHGITNDGNIDTDITTNTAATSTIPDSTITSNGIYWLRYEPFILHVACISLTAAQHLMNIVRPIFKNVGITSLPTVTNASSSIQNMNDADDVNDINSNANNNTNMVACPKYVVAIWGDEGLDMPLCNEDGISMIADTTTTISTSTKAVEEVESTSTTATLSPFWLASLVNERHERNRLKVAKLVQAIRDDIARSTSIGNIHQPQNDEYDFDITNDVDSDPIGQQEQLKVPRSYDVLGDVAILHTLPNSINTTTDNILNDTEKLKTIGDAIIQRNKAIKVVVLRLSNLNGIERAPGSDGILILTGPIDRIQRKPLLTTHREYGISCIVNIHHTFFSPRMGQERIRICNHIIHMNEQKRLQNNELDEIELGEHILVLFAGVCMDAFQIAARTNAQSITAIEYNDSAIECARKGHALLQRNTQCSTNHAAERLQIIHGDCLHILPTLPLNYYHRIIVPRPKEGDIDGDQPSSSVVVEASIDDIQGMNDNSIAITNCGGNGGHEFLIALLPHIRSDGGICHWYDFCADHEYPDCFRTVSFLQDTSNELNYTIQILHVAHVGSVAKRQLRVCIDFQIFAT